MADVEARLLASLAQRGWSVSKLASPAGIPSPIRARYAWVPEAFWSLVRELDECVAPDEETWLLTGKDYGRASGAAHAWDEWERLSLDAARDDAEWVGRITEFWDNHLPFMMSVSSGYAYVAIERNTLRIVSGIEPEFEETTALCSSFEEFVHRLTEDCLPSPWR